MLDPMPNGKLRAAIIGAGLIVRHKHLAAFAAHRRKIDVVAICDLDRDNAEAIARAAGIPRVYTDHRELLAKERPDVIDICTPPRTHADIAIDALRAGSHVLIEKPMAPSVMECDRIIAAAQGARGKVCVAHSSLFYPVVTKARALVAAGAIGTVRGIRVLLSTPTHYMTASESHWAHRLPGGVVGESAPHPVYLSLAFIKNITDVQVTAAKLLQYPWSAYEDYRIELVGESGISSIALTYASNEWAARLDVIGESGMLMLDLEGRTLVRYKRPALEAWRVGLSGLSEAGQIAADTISNGVRFITGRFPSTHQLLLGEFISSIREGREMPVPAADGRDAVRVLDLIAERIDSLRPVETTQ